MTKNRAASLARCLARWLGCWRWRSAYWSACSGYWPTRIAQLIAGGPAQDSALVAHLLRFTIPAILFLNFSGLLTAALFARRKFGITAFTATIFNLAFIALDGAV